MLMRGTLGAFFALGATGIAVAQNSFPTPGGATVPGYVNMCITGNLAVPCNPGGGGGFAGPGDVVAGALAWWGLRAYSAAKAGTKAANICNAGDAACADVNTLANGNFDVVTAQGAPLNCGGTGGTCTIKTLYDQSGAINCTTACDITGGLPAARPTLIFNCIGTRPCAAFVATDRLLNSGYVPTNAQPFTASMVADRTGALTAFGATMASAALVQLGFGVAANLVGQYAGIAIVNAAAADNTTHAIQHIVNGASGQMYIDGTSTAVSGSPGPSSIATSLAIGSASDLSNPFTGNFHEGGWWAGAFTGGQLSSMNSNQHAYWGF
jgi:hypothetical protein